MDETNIMLHWDRNKAGILSLIRKKVKKSHEADDILQEVFLKYWEKNHEIKDKDKIRQWLLSVTRFTIVDYYREATKDEEIKNLVSYYYSPDSLEESPYSDESKKLIPVIFGLPLKYRNMLLISDIYGLPHKVISRNLNLTETCVRTRVIRARKLLAEKMHECCTFTNDKYGNIINCEEKPCYKELLKGLKKNQKGATF